MDTFLRRSLGFARFLVLVGIICFLGAGISALQSYRLVTYGVRQQGAIIRFENSVGRDDGFFPVVGFEDSDGRQHEINSRKGNVVQKGEVGDPVGVLYLPGNPAKSSIDDFFHLWGNAIFFTAISDCFLIVGIFLLALVTMIRRRLGSRSKEGYLDNVSGELL